MDDQLSVYWQARLGSDQYFYRPIDPQGWFKALVKYDGCVDLSHAYNEPFKPDGEQVEDDSGDIHICDLDDFICRLIKLREQTISHFKEHGRHWPE